MFVTVWILLPSHGKPFRGISYLDGDRHVDAPFRRGSGRGVRRTVLHSALLDAAASAGVRICHDEVGEISQDATSVRAGEWRARADLLRVPARPAGGRIPPCAAPFSVPPFDVALDHAGRRLLVRGVRMATTGE